MVLTLFFVRVWEKIRSKCVFFIAHLVVLEMGPDPWLKMS